MAKGLLVRGLLSAAATALLVVAAGGCGHSAAPAAGLRIGVAYDVGGVVGNPVNTLAQKGVAAAKRQLGGRVSTVREFFARTQESDEDRYDRLIILCQSGYDPVLAVGYLYAGPDPATGPLARAAQACPRTRFAIVDDSSVSAPNVAELVFADADGAYLGGVAAGLSTRSGVVGFVGGCDIPSVREFLVGYRAGVLAARPGTQVRSAYLSADPAQCGPGFATAELGRSAGEQLYAGGADVVFQVAGASGVGVFIAAKEHDALAVGSGYDTYAQIGPALQGAVLTSVLQRVDTSVTGFLTGVAAGRFTAGVHREDLRTGGVGYAKSGPLIDPLEPRLDSDKQKIIDGVIAVPSGA